MMRKCIAYFFASKYPGFELFKFARCVQYRMSLWHNHSFCTQTGTFFSEPIWPFSSFWIFFPKLRLFSDIFQSNDLFVKRFLYYYTSLYQARKYFVTFDRKRNKFVYLVQSLLKMHDPWNDFHWKNLGNNSIPCFFSLAIEIFFRKFWKKNVKTLQILFSINVCFVLEWASIVWFNN